MDQIAANDSAQRVASSGAWLLVLCAWVGLLIAGAGAFFLPVLMDVTGVKTERVPLLYLLYAGFTGVWLIVFKHMGDDTKTSSPSDQ